jgi:uncharacterized protein
MAERNDYMTERPVSFDSDGLRLFGVLGLPDGSPKSGLVLIHGWSGYRIGPNRILVQAARAFNNAGVATLRFDLRGRGESEGDMMQTDLDGMIADACRAVDVLIAEVTLTDVGLLGMCSGANVAIGAGTLRSDVRNLLLWSVFTFQPQRKRTDDVKRTGRHAATYFRKMFRLATWGKLVRGRVNFRMVGRVLAKGDAAMQGQRNLKDSSRDIMAEFAQFKGRCLFIHGSRDAEAQGAREVFQEFCPLHDIPAEFALIEGANHNFHSAKWKSEVIARSIDWCLSRTPEAAR